MITVNDKIYRNLEEQVLQNHNDILYLMQEGGTLNEFGIKVVGQVDNSSLLPNPSTYDGEYGDAYAVGTNTPYTFYIYTRQTSGSTGDYWFNIGQFPVPSTVPGPQGPQGPTGPKGTRGSIWYSGYAIPTGTDYLIGDMYLRMTTGDVFQYTITGWVNVGNIKGPQGPVGLQGPIGNTGPQGPIGPVGPQGPIGQSFTIAGILANINQLPTPTEANRSQGYLIGAEQPYDLYVVVGTTTLTWTNVGRVEGVEGPAGPQGPEGQTGPQGPQGITGSPGPQGVSITNVQLVYKGESDPPTTGGGTNLAQYQVAITFSYNDEVSEGTGRGYWNYTAYDDIMASTDTTIETWEDYIAYLRTTAMQNGFCQRALRAGYANHQMIGPEGNELFVQVPIADLQLVVNPPEGADSDSLSLIFFDSPDGYSIRAMASPSSIPLSNATVEGFLAQRRTF